ncbi:MAG: TRAM domain-containing protein [Planctomycetes bacterium]|nr:TRAM domain-containing protein [Planctomycetota bacterium]
MALVILRCTFLMVASALAVSLSTSGMLWLSASLEEPGWFPYLIFSGVMLAAAAVIVADWSVRKKHLDIITAVYFGMIVGLFLTYVVDLALGPLWGDDSDAVKKVYRTELIIAIGMVLCYTCISVLIQTKDDFRFIIPYVEFSKEVKGLKPLVLDTSVIIDGRIADVIETQMLDNQLIVPRFVIAELQAIADSSDKMRRSRGRRGLDIMNRLRGNKDVDLTIFDRELPEFAGQPVDLKLVLLAKHLEGKVVTNDYNLNKVAKLHGVGVINLNDIANALKPVFLPGEDVAVRIVKAGEEAGQGVGYLDDGTMIVVEGAREHIGKTVRLEVTSVLQTSAGRMIFGKCSGLAENNSKDEK